MNELLAVPGLVTAERHTVTPLKNLTARLDFMLIYELDSEDPMLVLQNMAAAQAAISDLLESASTLSIMGISQGLRKEA